MTPEEYARARRLVMRRDPVLGAAIKRIGSCGLAARQHQHHLSALTGSIVSQQLSMKAAATIFKRFAALFPDNAVTDVGVIARLEDAELRNVGLSGQKVGYRSVACWYLWQTLKEP